MQPKRFFEADLKVHQLRVLVQLRQLGKVQKVADALHVTQPAISKQLREIESAIGTPLFERIGNRIEFTAVGDHLARRAAQILQELQSLETEVAALSKGLAGELSVGMVTTAVQLLVPDVLLRFRQLAPNACVDLVERTAGELFEMLDAGQVDLIVCRVTDRKTLQPDLSSVLLTDPLVICCSSGHPLALRTDLQWKDLEAMSWVAPARGSPALEAFMQLLDKHGVSPRIAVHTISITAIIPLLSSSDMLGLLPLSMARRLATEQRIRMLPLDTANLLGQISAHWKAGNTNPLASLMTDCLREANQLE